MQAAPTLTGSTTGFTTITSGTLIRIVPTTTLSGTVTTKPNSSVTLDFFDNDACDPSGFGEGQTYSGSRTFTSDASGNVTFQAQFLTTFSLATATATSASNDTSMFSRCRFVSSPFSTGTPHLSPAAAEATADVHQRLTYTFKWTVPPRATWHDPASLQLRLRQDSTTLLQVRWDASSNTFSLFNPASGKSGPAFAPGSDNVLESSGATLFLKDSRVKGAGPTAPTVTLTLTLSLGFRPSVAVGEYVVEVAASDDLGHTGTFAPVGKLEVAR